jgi:hypothetical protein
LLINFEKIENNILWSTTFYFVKEDFFCSIYFGVFVESKFNGYKWMYGFSAQ